MNSFFYKNWGLYYILLFFLIGWLVYSILWIPKPRNENVYITDNTEIERLKEELENCQNPPIAMNTVNCNNDVRSGGQGKTTTIHELGNHSGNVVIAYNMQTIPDKIDVFYENQLVASSHQLVSGNGTLNFQYHAQSGRSTNCRVVVSAPDSDTVWEYRLNCPR